MTATPLSPAAVYNDCDRLFTQALRAIKASGLDLRHRCIEMDALWKRLDAATNARQVEAFNEHCREIIARYTEAK